MIRRSQANLVAMESWVEKTDWVGFLAEDPAIRSNTSVCIKVVDPWFDEQDAETQGKAVKKMAALLDFSKAAYDIGGYRDAPAGLRIWCGATVETSDIEALLPWLDWAYADVKSDLSQ